MKTTCVAACIVFGFVVSANAQQRLPVPPPIRLPPQQVIPAPQPEQTVPPESSAKSELDDVLKRLNDQAKQVDGLVARLKSVTNMQPSDTLKQVDAAARTLSGLIDRLGDSGDLSQQVQNVRNAATTHRKRVEEMNDHTIDNEDKTAILKAWDDIMQGTDTAKVSMKNMRESLGSALGKLTRKRVAISEMLLANQYQAAISSFNAWVRDLEQTTKNLHEMLGRDEPRS
jgi:ABC-type transporter Mla subunit MlaD